MDSTTTSGDSSCHDARPTKREKTLEALTEALETEELTEKDYHIREALQLVTLNEK